VGYKTKFVLHRRHITSPLQRPAVTVKNAISWDLGIVRNGVSEEHLASIFRIEILRELGKTLAVY
jgi:hypothetical protein